MSTDIVVKDIKPYTVAELATFYEVGDRTFKRWLEPFKTDIGEKNGRYYSVVQVKTIFKKLGIPGKLKGE
jgi:transcriptional regulator GlxA family with amidase domain